MSNSPTREEKERAMLKRALYSIDDLLEDEASNANTATMSTRMYPAQKREMQNIIADAIAQGIR